MSKQDGYASRTAADLERKYNFGQTFAEVYNLVTDARKAAEEAKNAYEGLDQEQIFNLLTNFGEAEGIYRDDDGNVYVNASYIKSGKLAAEYIDATSLKVDAANITGTLTAGQIDATNLKVSAANITGKLTIGSLPDTVAEVSDIPTKTSQLTNNSGFVNTTGVTTIVNGIVTTDYVEALGIKVDAAKITGKLSLDHVASISFDDLTDADDIRDELGGGLNESQVSTLITNNLVSSPTIAGGVFYDINQEIWLRMYPNTGDGGSLEMASRTNSDIFRVSEDTYSDHVNLYLGAYRFLSAYGRTIYALGTWDFSNATVYGI